MPELPEVETARSLIADQALDRDDRGIDDSDTYVTRPHTPGQLRDSAGGTQAHGRPPALQIHLGRDVRAGWGPGARPGPRHPPRHERPDRGHRPGREGHRGRRPAGPRTPTPASPSGTGVTIDFADGGRLALFDTRRLGRVRLDPDISALGRMPGRSPPRSFRRVLGKGTIAVKARLLDQSKIAGVGNLLADEALWQARINPRGPP